MNPFNAIVLFGLEVFVLEHSFRIARAADIRSDACVPVGGEKAKHALIADPRTIPSAIGDVLHDGRHRV